MSLKSIFIMLGIAIFFQPSLIAGPADEEVILTFNHPAVGQYYITAIYSNNSMYLPAVELFNLLYIHYEKGESIHSLKGNWPNDNKWEIDPTMFTAISGKETVQLTTADFRVGEMDLYLSPEMFEKIFGLKFTFNMNTLSLSLESDRKLPIEEKKEHEQLRTEIQKRKDEQKDYKMMYPRNRKIAGAGLMDYNLGLYSDNSGISGLYSISGGMELLGGDIQGTVYGIAGHDPQSARASNLFWRYAMKENPYFTSIRAGQITTTGLLGQRVVGAAVSNDPIEPRKVYNSYSIDGNTIPDSEVELYINNQLTDYTRSDELGYYRFSFSLTYGTVRINLRIYTPTGEILTEERELQIPFTFLPEGVVSYNLQAGAVDDGVNPINSDRMEFHGDIAWGVAKNITAKVGTDYLNYTKNTIYYGTISARVFDQYLVNLELVPGNFYRATGSVTYPSSKTYNLVFTRFQNNSLFNPRNAKEEIEANLYLPISIVGLQSGIRFGGEHFNVIGGSLTNYNIDLSTRIGRFNIRSNYRDQLSISEGVKNYGTGLLTGSVTYTFSRTPGVPVFVKGMFLRGQAQYDIHNKQFATAGLQFSRTILKKGRINATIDHDFRISSTRFQAGFILDLNTIRSNSQLITTGKTTAVQQTFIGSIGLDSRSARLSATNREQVGRAAVSVLMFVDSNDNGKFDLGEQKVPSKALRLNEAATLTMGKDSILRITQLQSYWKYNAEIAVSALPDPTLAPLLTQFSFIADPDRYKRIEIPLYRTGVIEGKVYYSKDGSKDGLGGVRLLMKSQEGETVTIRTFADGGFYAMNVMPGKYTIQADPAQLSFLNAKSYPQKRIFEVRAIAEGDYVENLDLLLATGIVQNPDTVKSPGVKEIVPGKVKDTLNVSNNRLKDRVQIGDTLKEPIQKAIIIHEITKEFINVVQDEYSIQLGSFSKVSNAQNLIRKVADIIGRRVEIIRDGDLYKVRVPQIRTRREVDEIIWKLNHNNFNELWVISLKSSKKTWVTSDKLDTARSQTEIKKPSVSLQVGSFKNQAYARKLEVDLPALLNKPAEIIQEGGLFKVIVTGLASAEEVNSVKKQLLKIGVKDSWIVKSDTIIAGTDNSGKTSALSAGTASTKPYSLRVGEFSKYNDAVNAQHQIDPKSKTGTQVVKMWNFYYVMILGISTKEEAMSYYPQIKELGYNKIAIISGL